MSKKRNSITVVVACHNSVGEPEFVATQVLVTKEQFDNGDHYDLAKEKAMEDDYEEPFVCFDEKEMPKFLKRAFEEDKIHIL